MALSRNDRRSVSALLEEAKQAINAALTDPNGPNAIVAQHARDHIVARTKAGVDARGQRFKPYAESTKRRKRKKGQRIRPPSLTDSGQMLDALTVQNTGRTLGFGTYGADLERRFEIGTLAFASREMQERARRHITGTRHMPARDMLGIEPLYAAQLAAEYEAMIARRVPTDLRRKVRLVLFSP